MSQQLYKWFKGVVPGMEAPPNGPTSAGKTLWITPSYEGVLAYLQGELSREPHLLKVVENAKGIVLVFSSLEMLNAFSKGWRKGSPTAFLQDLTLLAKCPVMAVLAKQKVIPSEYLALVHGYLAVCQRTLWTCMGGLSFEGAPVTASAMSKVDVEVALEIESGSLVEPRLDYLAYRLWTMREMPGFDSLFAELMGR